MTIPEAIELLKAVEAGKVIEYSEHPAIKWKPVPPQDAVCRIVCVMDGGTGFLRVKSEPREWWAGICNGKPFRMYSNRLEAEMYLKDYPPSHCEIVRVREVIDP